MPIEPNAKARLFNDSGHAANTAILSTNVTPSASPTVHEWTVAVNATSTPTITEWDNSTTTEESYTPTNGTAIAANSLHTFQIPARESSEYNIEFDAAVEILVLNVDERGYYEG